jgi:hypothetical protein
MEGALLEHQSRTSKRRILMTQTDPFPTGGEQHPAEHEEWHLKGDELVGKVRELLHEGNVRRIIVKQDEHRILEIPLTVGIVGTLLAPWLAAVGALGALLTHCTIEVVRSERSDEPPTAQA